MLHSSGALLDLPGALVLAIKDYKGGVLIISHNKARRSFACSREHEQSSLVTAPAHHPEKKIERERESLDTRVSGGSIRCLSLPGRERDREREREREIELEREREIVLLAAAFVLHRGQSWRAGGLELTSEQPASDMAAKCSGDCFPVRLSATCLVKPSVPAMSVRERFKGGGGKVSGSVARGFRFDKVGRQVRWADPLKSPEHQEDLFATCQG